MIVTKVIMKSNLHTIHFTVDDRGVISIFKYTEDGPFPRCEFDIFTDRELATDFVLEPLSNVIYNIVGDDGEPLV
jgi:hypothetical protein